MGEHQLTVLNSLLKFEEFDAIFLDLWLLYLALSVMCDLKKFMF
jgi:hypothetical protein